MNRTHRSLFKFLWFAPLLGALLSGCAPAPVKMSDAERKTIQVVSISKQVSKPPAPYYLGPGGGVGLMFGAVGALVSEPGRAESRNSFLQFLDDNQVSIERIVLEEVTTAVRGSGKLTLAETPTSGGVVFKVTVRQYGLSIPNGFSSRLVPILSLLCEMTDASGKVLWSAGDRVLTLGNPVESVAAEEMLKNPKAIEAAWRAASRHIANAIVREL